MILVSSEALTAQISYRAWAACQVISKAAGNAQSSCEVNRSSSVGCQYRECHTYSTLHSTTILKYIAYGVYQECIRVLSKIIILSRMALAVQVTGSGLPCSSQIYHGPVSSCKRHEGFQISWSR